MAPRNNALRLPPGNVQEELKRWSLMKIARNKKTNGEKKQKRKVLACSSSSLLVYNNKSLPDIGLQHRQCWSLLNIPRKQKRETITWSKATYWPTTVDYWTTTAYWSTVVASTLTAHNKHFPTKENLGRKHHSFLFVLLRLPSDDVQHEHHRWSLIKKHS